MVPPPTPAPLAVLLIEDDWVNQKIALKLFELLAHPCDLATSGEEGLEMIKRHPYDLILLDIEMTGINGFETLRQIREWETATQARPSYVAACTAFALPSQRRHCLNAGMDAFLAKPLKQELVVQVIEQCRAARE